MDNQEKTFLITIALAIGILFVFRPKKSKIGSKVSKKTSEPKKSSVIKTETNNKGMIAINAMRTAINDGVKQKEATNLQRIIMRDYGLKVVLIDKKLFAKDANGKIIAKENGST